MYLNDAFQKIKIICSWQEKTISKMKNNVFFFKKLFLISAY
jgi:hypothetical protein